MQEGDVLATYTDASALAEWVGFQPTTSLSQGIERFVKWYVEHYAH
jgi:UDP-glucuronate 4-epimerase